MAGIYIHIPFCHSKCSYCDFYSLPNGPERIGYIKSAVKELKYWLARPETAGIKWNTIYIGGGTPSILTPEELECLIAAIPLDNAVEFTIEANPEDITAEWVNTAISMGINRISIGIQSFSDEELKFVKRNHQARQAVKALEILKQSDIKNISADLIYGLPTQTIDSWSASLEALLEFHPEHISAYSLSYEPGTRLFAMLRAGHLTETNDDTICEMYRQLTERLSASGYEHYEISNFGLKGKHSLHNSSYWTFTPYLGIGAAAHGYIAGIRYANPWNVARYMSDIAEGHLAAEQEVLTGNDIYNEYLMVSLRTSEGLVFQRLEELTNADYNRQLKMSATALLKAGLLERTPNGVRIPENKWLISDSIIRDLMI